MPSGGQIVEISCNHPVLGMLIMYGKSNEDSTYDTGNARTSDDANMIDGSGAAIYQMNIQRPSFSVKISWDMVQRGELEYLSSAASSPFEGVWTFTNINQTIYKMTGKPVGDVQGNGNSSTIDLKVQGSGQLTIL